MRDLDRTTHWSETLTVRISYQHCRALQEHQESSTRPSGLKTGLGCSVTDDCRVMRFSSHSLVALRSLPPTSLILLLTPVLRPATSEKANPKIDSKDPFEDFGRELSKMHQRLRHVPYVPKVGMIETHVAFIQQAAAVIVVICEPTESDSESLSHQRSFADAVSATGHGLSGTSAVPFVLVRFDADDVDSNDEEYENVLHATSLTKRASSRATQLLFKQEA